MSDVSLATRVGKVEFPTCFGNASGPLCTYDHEIEPLSRSAAGAVVWKSATRDPRGGNPEPRLSVNPERITSINSNGLCNLGYEAHALQIEQVKHATGKRVIASASAMKPGHFPMMVRRFGSVADAVEVNLSCPNLPGKPQTAFDLEASRAVLSEVREATDCDLWVKLPPMQDRRLVEQMADLLAECGVQAAVCINSPSGLEIDLETETTRIHPNRGMGGVGGSDILRIALWNVRQFYLAAGGRFDVVGCGGVTRGADLYRHILAGASFIEVGTAYLAEGPGIFARLEGELRALCARKGVTDIRAKIGQLQVLPAQEDLPAPAAMMAREGKA